MPKCFERHCATTLFSIIALLVGCQHCFAELKIGSNFEGGSAEVVSIDEATQTVHVMPKVVQGRGFPCWWYFRLDGIDATRPVQLKISANPKPFQGKRTLSNSWALPDQAAVSLDNTNWKQTSVGKRDGASISFEIKVDQPTVWFAWGPPFVPSHANNLLQEVKAKLPDSKLFVLAKTRNGHSVNGIRFGADPAVSKKPYGVWVQARQHAWEAGSSWVGQGFLLWSISDDPMAMQFRKTATIHFIPIMDVDSVTDGVGGKDAIPRDHNRDWDDQPVYPEVAAAQKMIAQLNEQGQFDIFIDLHNPGPNDRKPFFFGPDLKKLKGRQRENFVRWMAITHSTISEAEAAYRFTSYIKSEEVRNRVSVNWVRNHTALHVLSTTLETAWNRPDGNQKGYLKVGQQFGISLARYLEQNPREE